MSFNVRLARIDDVEGMTHVLNPIVEEGLYTVLDTTFTPEEEQEFIRNFPEQGILTVAQHDESLQIAGFQAVEPFANYTRVFDHVGIIGTFVDASLPPPRGRQAFVRDNLRDCEGQRLREAICLCAQR